MNYQKLNNCNHLKQLKMYRKKEKKTLKKLCADCEKQVDKPKKLKQVDIFQIKHSR